MHSLESILKTKAGFKRESLLKDPKTGRLSEEAKLKLRAAIHDEPKSETTDSKVEGVIQPVLKTEKRRKSGKPKQFSSPPSNL